MVQMWDMAHSICLIELYQMTMRKKNRFFVSDYLNETEGTNSHCGATAAFVFTYRISL